MCIYIYIYIYKGARSLATGRPQRFFDSFQTGSGQTGTPQKYRDSRWATSVGKREQHIAKYGNIGQNVTKCGNM